MQKFQFKILKNHSKTHARAGEMHTPHGIVQTPVFMTVGTQATVKSLDSRDIKELKAQIILGNTYHLYLRPGEKLIKDFGGIHGFMKWDGPILTDSGGYQVTSLGLGRGIGDKNTSFVKIDDEGVTFKSHWDGSLHRFTPEKAIQIQEDLGADIIMAFDEATPLGATYSYAQKVLERTHAWAKRCIVSKKRSDQALFGIIQGGFYEDLRQESAREICALPFDGIAIGGGDVGSDLKKTEQIIDWIYDLLPHDKPLYAMGVGVYPQDVIDAVGFGVDMFDCVAPTRIARSGLLYCGQLKAKGDWFIFDSKFLKGRLNILKKEFAHDKEPIDKNCECQVCKTYSRAYLHHLFRVHELSAYRLASIHNLHFMVNLVQKIRTEILDSTVF